jgi:SNF2 family DNA or RNA helicase
MELFRRRNYAALILDEIQFSKNRDSETHQSLRDFPARSIIGLSGTPLENSVWEVKNLFDLILPGYFPGESQFRRDIAEPLESGMGVEAAKTRFMRLTRPFLLRRLKSEVLSDLPEKIEENYTCDLAPDQAALYHTCLKQKGGPLLRELLGQGKGQSQPSMLHIFQLLNHLKQICNHPMTLSGAEAPDIEYSSGKWDLFVFLLEKSLAAGHKIVVFSQYLGMLEWIEKHLQGAGIGFAVLTGATQNRPAVLKRFATDPGCRVFCCSLKAGGIGIDLTSAETVIHYDRWWNAARENQATDRVHRIGQSKNVQVYKLVTRGTIEDRIDAIIRKKAAWMETLLPGDAEGGLKLFTREELIELLRGE